MWAGCQRLLGHCRTIDHGSSCARLTRKVERDADGAFNDAGLEASVRIAERDGRSHVINDVVCGSMFWGEAPTRPQPAFQAAA